MPFITISIQEGQGPTEHIKAAPLYTDGGGHPLVIDFGVDTPYTLEVALGDHIPRGLGSSSSPPPPTQAVSRDNMERRKRRRPRSNPQPSDANDEKLCITIRYVPPIQREDNKSIGDLYKYHVSTIQQIETALQTTKQARLDLEAAPATTKTDLVAVALEVHLLTKELNRRRGITDLSHTRRNITKWYLVRACVPAALEGLPGNPVIRLYPGDWNETAKPVEQVEPKKMRLLAGPRNGEAELSWFEHSIEAAPDHLQYRMVQEYSASALAGDKYGMYFYGKSLINGYGDVKDPKRGAILVRRAADQGLPVAHTALGMMYTLGVGVDRDLNEAKVWYESAADQGQAVAQYRLGWMHQVGNGVAQDYKRAAEWYQQAAEQGHMLSQYQLGLLYEYGSGVAKDSKQAANWYQQAADQDHVLSQYRLGRMCETNTGSKDSKRAAEWYRKAGEWYRKAADQGHVLSQDRLGRMYENGEGVAENTDEALRWYHKAAEQGHASSQYRLGELYYSGDVVPQDEDKAVAFFWKAARQGHVEAREAIEEALEDLE